ncbi:NlpC/P60 family protein [Domibacillus sp. PGB-M46]|uniref:C40 family peptidase n=1 Tax=Domibacillus sp. PGB-M46 TaxID=2910255 RepID=UPI001F5AB1FC|nr:C40 family peptidase [Domibacillus sp. PGB-M46]MCI2253863.1 NlpC/P60 family protein [Domibacillus sp. PGB-M46]
MNRCKKAITALLAAVMLLTLSPLTSFKTEAASVGESIVAYGKKFMGVPYVFGGTTPSGFDCSGFTQYIYRNAANISLPRTAEQQYNVGTAVSKSDLQVGDLVFFANTYKAGISHVGVYAGGNMVLNATSSQGIALVSLSNTYWGPKYAGAKRVVKEPVVPSWFTDVPTTDATYTAIKTLTDKEVINGFEDYTFRPDAKVTRGQAAAIMNRILGLKPEVMSHFTDVPKTYRFAYDIAAIREAGIITGFDDKTFRPEAEMTRNEMAAIIQRAFDLQMSQTAAASVRYSDIRADHWAYEGIVTMASIDKTGLFQGDKFYGTHLATREAFTVAIYNATNAQ